MMYERKQEMREKYLKVPPSWILVTIKRELNAYDGDTSDDRRDRHETALAHDRGLCIQILSSKSRCVTQQ
jgi:hypothetical protein